MEGLTFSMELRGKERVVWGVWEEEVAIRQSGWLAFAREWCRSPLGKHLQRNHKSSSICNTHGHNASTNLIGSISHSCSTTALEGTEMTLASERVAGARDRKDSPSLLLAGSFLAGVWLELSGGRDQDARENL